jgi:uncharacterized membrane protein
LPGSGASTMTVTTTATTATGTFTVTITGTSGTLLHSVNVALIVNPTVTGDFSISATPASLTITRGQSADYTVTVTALSGFTGTVKLSVTGVPASTFYQFGSSSITGSGNTTLGISPGSSASPGTYTLTITGTSSPLTHSAQVSLVIN